MAEITGMDVAWAAGFLEGEGQFCSNSNGSSPLVRANQVQREPLERLVAMFGGQITQADNHPNPRAQLIYRWSVGGVQGAGVMMTLFSLLSPRRQEQVGGALARWRASSTVQKTLSTFGMCAIHGVRSHIGTRPSGKRFCQACSDAHNAREKAIG